MKKVISLFLALVLCLSLCACGNTKDENASESVSQETSQEIIKEESEETSQENSQEVITEESEEISEEVESEESTPVVTDHFDTETFSLVCTGAEKAHPGLNDYGEENLWIIKFDFINKTAEHTEVQDYCRVTFYQNNIEVDPIPGVYSSGEDHYTLCTNYWKNCFNGSCLSVARAIEFADASPVTIFMEDKETGTIATITVELTE